MQSFRSKLFLRAIVFRRLLKLQSKEKIISEQTDIKKLRAKIEKGSKMLGKIPADFRTEGVQINELEAEWIIPDNTEKNKAILYFHGGGLVVGSFQSHRAIVSKFVKASGVPAMVFNYALAPENPFPAGLNDSISAYKYLLSLGISNKQIIFMGDSGGGNLVFAAMLALKEQRIELPAGAVALSPWTDLTNSGESWQTNSEADKLCWKESQTVFSKYYADNNDPANPLISPLFGYLSGLPPILIFAGGNETLLSDSIRFVDKAKLSGVSAEIKIGEGLFHCYPACAPFFPEAVEAVYEIGDFIKKLLNR